MKKTVMKKTGLIMAIFLIIATLLSGCPAPGYGYGQSTWNRSGSGSWNSGSYGGGQIVDGLLRGMQEYGRQQNQQQYPRQYTQQQNCHKKFIGYVRDRNGRLYKRYEITCPSSQQQDYDQYYPR